MKRIQQIPVLSWLLFCWYIFVAGALLTTTWNIANYQRGSQDLQIAVFLLLEGIHLSISLCILAGRWTPAVRSLLLLLLAGGVLLLTQVAQSVAVTFTLSPALLIVALTTLLPRWRLLLASAGYLCCVVLYALTLGSALDWKLSWDSTGAATLFFVCFALGGFLLYVQQKRAHQQTHNLFRQLDGAYTQLQEANRQLSVFALHIEDLTMLNERQRIARELHDTLIQGIVGLIMQLEVISTHTRQQHLERVQTLVQQAMTDARVTLADARCALSDLRAEHLRPDDLVEVVQEETNRFTATTDIPCMTNIAQLAQTPPALCVQILRVISEGLTNIAHHAQARRVEIHASFVATTLQIEIWDNGVGFDPTAIKPEEGHYGLLGLRERARLIGGQLTIVSKPGLGTSVCLQIPLAPEGAYT